jgi:hypothetical protein
MQKSLISISNIFIENKFELGPTTVQHINDGKKSKCVTYPMQLTRQIQIKLT